MKDGGLFFYIEVLTGVSQCDILITQCDISRRNAWRDEMDAHIKKVYVPMTETGFYILLCLQRANHGYGIVQEVEKKTQGEIRLSPGTMYGSLSKMEKDGLICFVREEDKRKIYEITPLGAEILELEKKRIERLYRNSREGLI